VTRATILNAQTWLLGLLAHPSHAPRSRKSDAGYRACPQVLSGSMLQTGLWMLLTRRVRKTTKKRRKTKQKTLLKGWFFFFNEEGLVRCSDFFYSTIFYTFIVGGSGFVLKTSIQTNSFFAHLRELILGIFLVSHYYVFQCLFLHVFCILDMQRQGVNSFFLYFLDANI
jgi:hypothetical protein